MAGETTFKALCGLLLEMLEALLEAEEPEITPVRVVAR